MRQVITTTTCDICGKGSAQTVQLVRDREADLCEEHNKQFEAALAPFFDVSRKSDGARPRTSYRSFAKRTAPAPTQVPASQSTIRAWAQSNGLAVSDRGRIPQHIVSKYQAAHS